MGIEETLSNYGALGAVCLFFMGVFGWAIKWLTNDWKCVVEANTVALTTNSIAINHFNDNLKYCPVMKKRKA
jgi:hypothetical protein